jgi:tryptophan synthase alpha chain
MRASWQLRALRGGTCARLAQGVMGASHLDTAEVAPPCRHPPHVTLPVGVGFGIRRAASAQAIAAHASDAVVIGSRIIRGDLGRTGATRANGRVVAAGIRSALDSMRKPERRRRRDSPSEAAR